MTKKVCRKTMKALEKAVRRGSDSVKEFVMTKFVAIKPLQDAGFEVFFVGGCVRDFVMGRTPKDFDICVKPKPEHKSMDDVVAEIMRVMDVSQEERFGKAPEKFGVVCFKRDGVVFEIAAMRDESDCKSRSDAPKMGTFETDAMRRDFTICAMFMDPDTFEIIDPCGGIDDIKQMVIRTTGDPREVFDVDPVRIERAFKFARRFGFRIAPEVMAAIEERS